MSAESPGADLRELVQTAPATSCTRRSAVFLDRDGTLTREVDGVCAPEDLELLPGAADAVCALNHAGLAAIVVTNQSAVARGLIDERELARIHAHLERELARSGARLSAIYVCPHHPDVERAEFEPGASGRGTCECRKPKPGLLLRAAREHDLDLAHSWIIGDAERDIDAGRAAGVRGCLVATGKGSSEHARMLDEQKPPDLFEQDLRAAVERILALREREAQGK